LGGSKKSGQFHFPFRQDKFNDDVRGALVRACVPYGEHANAAPHDGRVRRSDIFRVAVSCSFLQFLSAAAYVFDFAYILFCSFSAVSCSFLQFLFS